MKKTIKKYLDEASTDRSELLDAYRSDGKKEGELDLSHVSKVIWLNKSPKFWVPSEFQINNMFGRSVLAIILFSIPKHFPQRTELSKFGYLLDNGLKHNLCPSIKKERNINLLSSVLKKSAKVGFGSKKGKKLKVRASSSKMVNQSGSNDFIV